MTFIWGLIRSFVLGNLPAILLYGGIALGAMGIFTWWSVHQYNNGYDAAIADIAAENQGAIDAANMERAKVRGCYDAGRTWDSARGVCQ